jgi:hypothetical protein
VTARLLKSQRRSGFLGLIDIGKPLDHHAKNPPLIWRVFCWEPLWNFRCFSRGVPGGGPVAFKRRPSLTWWGPSHFFHSLRERSLQQRITHHTNKLPPPPETACSEEGPCLNRWGLFLCSLRGNAHPSCWFLIKITERTMDEIYLQKANEAQQRAYRASSKEDREAWQKVARGWMSLIRRS